LKILEITRAEIIDHHHSSSGINFLLLQREIRTNESRAARH
jgi:hypothetical protein